MEAHDEEAARSTRARTIARDPTLTVTLTGKAVRDAAPLNTGGPFPLVMISHGYPGNRYLMSHIGENLSGRSKADG